MPLIRTIVLLALFAVCTGTARAERVAELLRHVANAEDRPEARLVVVASSSLSLLDRESAQLMRAMDMTTASTLGQALNVLGIRQAIDMDRPMVSVMDLSAGMRQPMVIIGTRNADRFETALRAEVLDPETNTLRFDFAGMPMVARRIDANTIAVAPELAVLNALLRDEPRAGAWHAGVPEAGMAALERAPLAAVGEGLGGHAAAVGLGFGLFDEVVDRPGVVVFSPGPLGLRVDSYVGEDGATREADGIRGEPPLRTLRREGAFVAGQVHTGHPAMQGILRRFVEREDRRSSALMVELVRAAMPMERIAWTTRVGEGADVLSVTGLEMLTGTTVHWTSADPAGDVARVREKVEALAARAPGGAREGARFVFNEAGLAAADRTLGSWSLQLPHGRFAGMNFNRLREGLIAIFPPRNQAMMLRGDVSWRDGLGSATFIRGAEEAVVDHRACPPGESFDGDAVVNQVRSFLPGNRVAEVYVDMRVVLEGVMPTLEEAGMGYALPAVVPPMGMALGAAEGYLHGGAFVPAIALRPVGGLVLAWFEEMAVGQEIGVGGERP